MNVTTQHNDNARTGLNPNETILTPQNVAPSTFGKLFSQMVDGLIVAQPLYLSNVTVPGSGVHNVVYVATEGDSVYAFDADNNGGSNAKPLWHALLTSTAYGASAGATTVPSADTSLDITPKYGITGTPVIDPASGTLYAVSFTKESGSYFLRLHALDVATGQEKFSGPVTLTASVPGTGTGSSGGVLNLDPHWSLQRPGLLLMDNILYIATAAHGDNGPWHGWLLAYNPSTLQQIAVYNASPNGMGSGIWMGGNGLAGDNSDPTKPYGRIFFATGNGDFNATPPYTTSMDYGDSILRVSLNSSNVFSVDDSFTPANQSYLNQSDGDLGSAGVLLLPTQTTGQVPNLLVQLGKDGTIHLLNRDGLGGYHPTDQVVQEISNGATSSSWGAGLWGGPAYWNNTVYLPGRFNPIKAYTLKNGLLSTTPTGQTPESYNYGTLPSVSSYGNTNAILWVQDYGDSSSATLRAYDAANLSNELYSSDTNLSRDSPGNGQRFPIPTIANGKVYVRAAYGNNAAGILSVYGLLNGVPTASAPVFSPGSSSFTSPISVSISSSTSGASIYYTTDGTNPTTSSNLYTGPIALSSATTITAIATKLGYLQSQPSVGVFTFVGQTGTPVISLASGTYTGPQTVTLSDATAGATLYYTLDGSTPTTSSPQYNGNAITIPQNSQLGVPLNVQLNVLAVASGLQPSSIASAQYVVNTLFTIDHSQGFTTASDMQFNGNTTLDDSRLQVTNGGMAEASSAFYKSAVKVSQFTTDFSLQLSNPLADGSTFVIQGVGPTALGYAGGGLGYQGIKNSVAIKFDLHSNAGEGVNSTGIYFNGVAPTIPAISFANTGIDLHSGDIMFVHLTYDGVNLIFTITDSVTNAVFTTNYQVNIPAVVGGNFAYVGFTGGSGGQSSSQKILTWTFLSGPPTVTNPPALVPNYLSGITNAGLILNGAVANSTKLVLTDGGTQENRSAYFATKLNTKNFVTDFDFQLTQALADGFTFVVQGAGPTTLGVGGSGLGSWYLGHSMAVKFDLHNNNGEGTNSTGMYIYGAWPTTPFSQLNGTGITLSSGDIIHAHITYDGTNLVVTLTDAATNGYASFKYPVNLPQVVNGYTGWFGFAGASATQGAVQSILNWTYSTK